MPKKVTSKEAQMAIVVYRGVWKNAKTKHAAHLGKVKFNKNLGPTFEKWLKLCDAMDVMVPKMGEEAFVLAVAKVQLKLDGIIDFYEKQVKAHVTDNKAKKSLLAALDEMHDAIYGD